MNYQSIYDRIIERNRNTPKIKKQTENHHIIPKSFAKLDGIEDINGKWNRVNLPLREHFICHLLLARIWRGHKSKGPKMARAFNLMSAIGKHTSKKYEWLKLNVVTSCETKQKISESLTGKKRKPFTEKTKQKLSEAHKGKKLSDTHKEKLSAVWLGRNHTEKSKQQMSLSQKGKCKKPLSEETKIKISEAQKGKSKNKGRILSEDHKKKISEALLNSSSNRGKARSEETKRKISEALQRRKANA